MTNILRDVRIHPHYRLRTYDTGRCDKRGQTYIGYEFWIPKVIGEDLDQRFSGRPPKHATGEEEILFKGEDFAGSPMHADDSNETLASLMSSLTFRKGDTDSEYFGDYNEVQLQWCDSYECEQLQGEISIAEEEKKLDQIFCDID